MSKNEHLKLWSEDHMGKLIDRSCTDIEEGRRIESATVGLIQALNEIDYAEKNGIISSDTAQKMREDLSDRATPNPIFALAYEKVSEPLDLSEVPPWEYISALKKAA